MLFKNEKYDCQNHINKVRKQLWENQAENRAREQIEEKYEKNKL